MIYRSEDKKLRVRVMIQKHPEDFALDKLTRKEKYRLMLLLQKEELERIRTAALAAQSVDRELEELRRAIRDMGGTPVI